MAAAASGTPTDTFAWVRHGYAACLHGSSVYVWGGVVALEGRKTAELLALDLDYMQGRVQPSHGDRPSPRDGHALAVDPASRHLLVFGGRKANGRRAGDLHLLSLDTWAWSAPKLDGGAAPPPREQCAAAFADGKLLVFGGRAEGARLNDLWLLHTATWRWEQLPARGTAPSPRQGAAACFAGGKLWVMGGTSTFTLDDCYSYSLHEYEWESLAIEPAPGCKAAARAGSHAILPDGAGGLWCFGGRDALGAQATRLLRLRQRAGTTK